MKAGLEQSGFSTREAGCGTSAIDVAARERPAAVVLDVAMPQLSGYEVCRTLRERYGRQLPILFLSGDRVEAHDRVAGLLLGADDYMVKPFSTDELVARVRSLLRRSAPPARPSSLTPREQHVLDLLAEGLNQRQIAERLVISTKTVGTHIERILSKLGVRSRAEAVAAAYRENLLST